MANDELSSRRRKRRWRRLLPWALASLLGAVAVWAAFFSPLLATKSISVQGATLISADEVVEASGIQIGQPIPAIDAEAVQAGVQSLPEIAQVEVRRALPNEVILVVTERTPVAATVAPTGWRFVDAEGILFAKLLEQPTDFPLIEASTESTRIAAAEVAALLPGWLTVDLDRVRALSVDDVRLELKDGRRVLWGSTDRPARKLQVLEPLMRLPAAVYDVSAPDVPTTRGDRPQD